MIQRKRAVIAHVGILGDRPGGIAQVVNQYLGWPVEGHTTLGILSTRGRRDWAAPFLWAVAVVRLVALRATTERTAVLVHLSAKGSFIREGSLVIWARALGHQVGVHLHGSQFPSFSGRHPKLVRAVCGKASVVFVLTDESLDILQGVLGPGSTRLVRLSNVVDLPATFGPKERTVVFGGEVGPRKGADVLLSAWKRIGADRRDWSLVLAGPVRNGFESELLDMTGAVSLGTVSHEELLTLQSRAAIAVLPSRHEAMPMFLLESMARGCAVIATPVGQVEELVAGVGEVVSVGDVSGLADALRNLIADPALVAQRGQASRLRVEERYAPAGVQEMLVLEWSRLARGESDK